MRRWIMLATCLVAGNCILAPLVYAGPASRLDALVRDGERLARETLGPNDGWAAFSTGTTGGSAASADHVYVVSTRQELIDALSIGSVAKIVLVNGTINANVSDDLAASCAAYATNTGYTLEAYLAAFDPGTWGRTKVPSGPLETARKAAQAVQQKQVRIDIPSNTTIVGLGDDATFLGANIRLSKADNVIIRNITFRDAYDCFPQWDPTDGKNGNWNSQYDNIWLTGATHVWVDHCAFDDGDHPESQVPVYFGRVHTPHDGLLDITNQADLVTVSWSRFMNHDKVMLIGSTDSPKPEVPDAGRLRVTLHHNLYEGTVQRGPRVRFGQVHIYNDFYVIGEDDGYDYSWGVGVDAHVYAENNYFAMGSMPADQIIKDYRAKGKVVGTIYVGETCVNGPENRVDVLAEYNAAYPDTALSSEVGWVPFLVGEMHPTEAIPALVWHKAGPFGVKYDPHVPR